MPAPQAGHPHARPEFAQRAAHGFDLVQLAVFFKALDALLPELAVERLLTRGGHGRGVDAQIQTEPPGQFLGEAVGLGKKVASVDEDDGNLRIDLRDEVQHHRGLHTEARAEHDMAPEFLQSPPHAIFCRLGLQIAVPRRHGRVIKLVLESSVHTKEPSHIGPCRHRRKTQMDAAFSDCARAHRQAAHPQGAKTAADPGAFDNKNDWPQKRRRQGSFSYPSIEGAHAVGF